MTATARRVLLVLSALGVLVLGGAVPAEAHAALLGTDPGQGSVVATAPARITLRFSESVLLSDDSLAVYDPAGRPVEQGTAHHAPNAPDTATVNLRPGLGNGTYTVAWKAVSADTHPVSGAWTFSVGAPSKTSAVPRQQAAGGGPAGTLYGVGRYLSYLGYALLVGSAAFLAVCWPRGARQRVMQRLTVGGWALLTAATISLLLLRGPYVNGSGLGSILDLGALQAAVETKSGAALTARLLLLAAAAVFLSVLFGAYARREDPEERRDLAFGLGAGGAVIAVGIAATWAMAEHASVGIQPAVAMPVDVVHLLAMAGWLGGLSALLTALYRTSGIEAAAVRRFSRIAFCCVCVLVSTGVYQAWRQVGSWHALGSTTYGGCCWSRSRWWPRWWARRGSPGGGPGGWPIRLPGRPSPPRRTSLPGRPSPPSRTGSRTESRTESRSRPPVPRAVPSAPRAVPPTTRCARPNSPGSGRRWPARWPGSGGTPTRRAQDCAAPCWWRRPSPSRCWRSPPCSAAANRAARSRRPPPRRRAGRPVCRLPRPARARASCS